MNHRFLSLAPPVPGRRILREIAVALLNRYFNESLSRGRWEKIPAQPVPWWEERRDAQGTLYRVSKTSAIVSLRLVESHLETGTFDYKALGLFDPRCDWLDASVQLGPRFHAAGADGSALTFQLPTTLGDDFPLTPRLDREGQAFNSFQILLLNRILALRSSLVDRSGQFESAEWFQDLRSYVSECVSLVDTTLHQLYFKAKYSPLPGWKFDPARLGNRHGRRLTDKLGWVHQITGNAPHAEAELTAFTVIKDLRNHLQHFDPPCFCFTVEHDVVAWLNAMGQFARLAWKIRRAMGSPPCVPLTQMLLAPDVVFVPEDPSRPRVPPADNVGYNSTRGGIGF